MLRCASVGAAALIAAAFVGSPVRAQDLAPGRAKAAAVCQTCHGLDGMGRLPDAPHLAGQPAIYLERALRAYRSGERRNEMMTVVAKPLSDQEIREVSAYYAAIEIAVKSKP